MEAVREALEWASEASTDEALEVLGELREFMLDARGGKVEPIEAEGGLARLEGSRPILVVGDVHGDLESYRRILEGEDARRILEAGGYLVFLGDYVDRGLYSPEVFLASAALTLRLKGSVVMLRGNHEPHPALMPYPHDLPLHLQRRFRSDASKVYSAMMQCFQVLFHSSIWGDKIFLVHGGVPTEADSLEDVSKADESFPQSRVLEELLWNDPVEGIRGWMPSPRGAGRVFGGDVTERFLQRVCGGLKVVVRGHEPCEGYRVNHGGLVLTLFSRGGPPYFNGKAAYLVAGGEIEFRNAYDLIGCCVRVFEV